MRSLDDLDVHGRRVLVRVDFNVPLATGPGGEVEIADDTRIRAALPTIEELRGKGARLVLVSHLGRPHGHVDEALSMAPVAARLGELTGAPVALAPAVVGEEVKALTEQLHDGEMLLLENVRFEEGETTNDPAFARALAELADVYVNDAFGVAHRAHASTEGVAHLLPSAAGRLLEHEVKTLTGILEHPARPLVAIVGGSKVADKIAVIDRFLQVADVVMIGGAMCFPFLCAQGHSVGESLCCDEDVEHARHLLQRASDTHSPQPGRARLLVPTTSCSATVSPTTRSTVRSTASRCPPGGWASTSAPARRSATGTRSSARAPSSGMARWARSSTRRSRRARARSPKRWRRRRA